MLSVTQPTFATALVGGAHLAVCGYRAPVIYQDWFLGVRPYPEYSRSNSYPWSPFPPMRARPGPGLRMISWSTPALVGGAHVAAVLSADSARFGAIGLALEPFVGGNKGLCFEALAISRSRGPARSDHISDKAHAVQGYLADKKKPPPLDHHRALCIVLL